MENKCQDLNFIDSFHTSGIWDFFHQHSVWKTIQNMPVINGVASLARQTGQMTPADVELSKPKHNRNCILRH